MAISYVRGIGALVALVFALTAARADAAVFANFDANQFDANGFVFADFGLGANTPVDTSGGVLNIDVMDDLDGVNGLFGGAGSDIAADFDAATTNLVVDLTVGPNNAASAFRVTLADDDEPGTGDEHVFELDISGLTVGVPSTLTIPLSNGPLFTQGAFGRDPGDTLQNYGLRQLQIQSVFGSPDRLNILVDSVQLIDPDDPLLIEFNTSTYAAQAGTFAFGTFQDAGALDTTGPTFLIDSGPTGEGGGGFGFSGLNLDFDPNDYQIEIEAKLLGGNTAESFNLLLGDNDGDDSGPGLGSDDYIFSVDTAELNSSDFTTVTIPLGTGSESDIVTTFGFDNEGDGLQNFGLSQMQIQAMADDANSLNIEVLRFAIVERSADPADLNNDGFVDGLDLGILLGNFEQNADPAGGELNGTDPVDGLDLGILLGAWNPPEGVQAASVPEPSTVLLMGIACCLATGTRRRCA